MVKAKAIGYSGPPASLQPFDRREYNPFFYSNMPEQALAKLAVQRHFDRVRFRNCPLKQGVESVVVIR